MPNWMPYSTKTGTPFLIAYYCINQPINQSINQPISQSVSLSLSVSVCLCVCLSVCLPACLPGWLAGCLSVGRSVGRSVGLSVCRSVGLSVCRSVGRSVGPSVGPSVRRSVRPSALSVCSVSLSLLYPIYMYYSARSKLKTALHLSVIHPSCAPSENVSSRVVAGFVSQQPLCLGRPPRSNRSHYRSMFSEMHRKIPRLLPLPHLLLIHLNVIQVDAMPLSRHAMV